MLLNQIDRFYLKNKRVFGCDIQTLYLSFKELWPQITFNQSSIFFKFNDIISKEYGENDSDYSNEDDEYGDKDYDSYTDTGNSLLLKSPTLKIILKREGSYYFPWYMDKPWPHAQVYYSKGRGQEKGYSLCFGEGDQKNNIESNIFKGNLRAAYFLLYDYLPVYTGSGFWHAGGTGENTIVKSCDLCKNVAYYSAQTIFDGTTHLCYSCADKYYNPTKSVVSSFKDLKRVRHCKGCGSIVLNDFKKDKKIYEFCTNCK